MGVSNRVSGYRWSFSLQSVLNRLSASPRLWSVLRRIVENGFRTEKQIIDRELGPWQRHPQRWFLDFGCGTGEFAPCFPANQYIGIDIAPAYLRFAQHAYAGRFLAMRGTMLALRPQSCDAALVLGVLHHLPDQVAQVAIAELWRVLRPGALLLIMEDIPPPDRWNIAGHMMHWLDRGGFIRSEADYLALFGSGFALQRTYTIRSGICDYAVYLLQRTPTIPYAQETDL